jgi:hypothetical protein
MSDIFREVDEEVRRDQAVEFWSKYQIPIIAVVVLIVLATAGWRFYEWRRTEAAQAASARLEEALQLDSKGDKAAEAALSSLAADAPAGYRTLARLASAATLSKTDPVAATAAYDALSADASIGSAFQQAAKLRAAMLRLDAGEVDNARGALTELAAPTGAFRHTAQELLGILALQAHDIDAAGRWLDMIVTDRDAPQGAHRDSEILLGLVRSDKPAK